MAIFSEATPVASCPICGVAAASKEAESFPYFVRCSHCGGYFLRSVAATPFYPEEYFLEPDRPTLAGRLVQPLLTWFLNLRVRQVKRLVGVEPRRVLDYGAGRGQLVSRLRKEGIDVLGYDPSPGAVALAQRAGIPVSGKVPSGLWDLVMFWHSLEHTDEPLAVLESLHLAPRAKLLIAVPNAESWEAAIAKDRWFHYDFPFHRIHFTPRALEFLLRRAGFRIAHTDFFTPEYTISGLVQTLLNFFLPKNALYTLVSHRRRALGVGPSFLLAAVSLLLLFIFSPLLVTFYLIQLLFRRSGAMVVVAEYATGH